MKSKARNIVAVLSFIAVMLGVWRAWQWRQNELVKTFGGYELPDVSSRPTPRETPDQKLMRFRSEADALARSFVTNDVVGFRRIRWITSDTSSDFVTNWNGKAEAEFINQIGGVSTKLVIFTFATGKTGNILYCDPDDAAQREAANEAFARALGVKEKPTNGWPQVYR
jgi:hypothetical protein